VFNFADERIPSRAGDTLIYDLSLVCNCGYLSAKRKVGTLSIEDSDSERETYLVAGFSERDKDLEPRELIIPFDELSTVERWLETVIPDISEGYSAVFYSHPILGSNLLTNVRCPLCNCLLNKSWHEISGNRHSIY